MGEDFPKLDESKVTAKLCDECNGSGEVEGCDDCDRTGQEHEGECEPYNRRCEECGGSGAVALDQKKPPHEEDLLDAIGQARRGGDEARWVEIFRRALSEVLQTQAAPELARAILDRMFKIAGPLMRETGVELIAAERRRQVEDEGWDPGHDDHHREHEIAEAAAAYASPIGEDRVERARWPWGREWDKRPRIEDGQKKGDLLPTSLQRIDVRIRCLVKAGALVAAELDRLLRRKATGAEFAGLFTGYNNGFPKRKD